MTPVGSPPIPFAALDADAPEFEDRPPRGVHPWIVAALNQLGPVA